jgi:hypothetical protein
MCDRIRLFADIDDDGLTHTLAAPADDGRAVCGVRVHRGCVGLGADGVPECADSEHPPCAFCISSNRLGDEIATGAPRDVRRQGGVPEAQSVGSEAALVLGLGSEGEGPHASLDLLMRCPACNGPTLFCGGDRICPGGLETFAEVAWVTKVRATCLGLVCTWGPAASFGGVLLRGARALDAGPPPRHIGALARFHRDPAPLAPEAVPLALEYLHSADLAPLSRLSALLRLHAAPWLSEIEALAASEALRPPLHPTPPGQLVGLVCSSCVDDLPPEASGWDVFRDAVGYDDAIYCSGCGALHPHPLPSVACGAPHPVGRCMGGAWGSRQACLAHEGQVLDDEGLCAEGRVLYDRTLEAFTRFGGRPSTAWQARIVTAMVRARRWGRDAQRQDNEIARAVVTSPALLPVFAAAAKANPEAAAALAEMLGAPIDVSQADPAVVAIMSGPKGLDGVIAAGKAALMRARDALFGEGKPSRDRALPTRRGRAGGTEGA